MPDAWMVILRERVPFFEGLPDDLKQTLTDYVRIFAREKTFIGAGGMEITDEVKVVIAACAVRLVLRLDLSYYDRLREIIVYPYIFKHPEGEDALLGEASDWNTVVLSWPSVLEGLSNPRDGHETALHEFAHVLDRSADGAFDGTPKLRSRDNYGPWAKVMSRHFLRLRDNDSVELKVLRPYGALNEAEFFAVATEAYFEKPRRMRKRLPDLYAELQEFYGGNPAEE